VSNFCLLLSIFGNPFYIDRPRMRRWFARGNPLVQIAKNEKAIARPQSSGHDRRALPRHSPADQSIISGRRKDSMRGLRAGAVSAALTRITVRSAASVAMPPATTSTMSIIAPRAPDTTLSTMPVMSPEMIRDTMN
jgi:hypothetical protein